MGPRPRIYFWSLSFMMCTFFPAQFAFGQSESDSIRKAYYSSKKWPEKAEIAYQYAIRNLGRDYAGISAMYLELLAHENELLAATDRFNVYNVLGIVSQAEAKLDSSNKFLFKAKAIALAIPDSSLWIKTIVNLGINYRHQGDYENSLEYSWEALDYYRKQKNVVRQSSTLNDIANAYCYLEEYEKCESYNRQALALVKALPKGYFLKGNIYHGLAYSLKAQNKIDSAYYFVSNAVKFHEQSKNLYALANSKRMLCSLNQLRGGSKNEELNCLLDQLALERKIQDNAGIVSTLININICYDQLGQLRAGIPYLQEAIALAKENEDNRMLVECFHSLSIKYRKLADYKLAYENMRKAFTLEDSIRGEGIQQQILELEQKFELAEAERILSLEKAKSSFLAKENAEADAKVANRNKWIFGLIGGSLATLFLGMYFLQRNKRKLQEEKDLALIEERDYRIKAEINAQEEERKRISKDLHDGVGQQLSALKMAWGQLVEDVKGKVPEVSDRLTKLTTVLNNSADEVRGISHQMMPRSLQELGLVPAIDDMLQKAFEFSTITYTFEQFKAQERFEENVEIGLYRICQELINNVIKHAEASKVVVQLIRNNRYLVLIVEDNGKGLDLSANQRGHGLMNIQSRLTTVNGSVNFEPSPTSGTAATIRVPIHEN